MDSDDDYGKKPYIIIDNGSYMIKSGFSNYNSPRYCFRNCLGYPKNKDFYYKDYYIGNQMKGQMCALRLDYPIKDGVIQNWDSMEKIWGYLFKDQLSVDPSQYGIILTQPLMNSKDEKERMAQIMFETFDIPSLYLAYSIDLSAYGSLKRSGLFIDLGANSTQISAILDCAPIPYKFERLYFGGNAITDYLFDLFHRNSKMFYNDKNKSSVEYIKEEACYVALDFDYEKKSVEPFTFSLPDNKDITVMDERIKATEAIFYPSLINKDNDLGLHKICNKIIESCGDNKKELYNCINISGGNSLFEGLRERLEKEIKNIAKYDDQEEVRVNKSENGKFTVWMGGKILSEVSTFENLLITKEMYEESGCSIIYKNDNYMLK